MDTEEKGFGSADELGEYLKDKSACWMQVVETGG
jgi:hypothetical protein